MEADLFKRGLSLEKEAVSVFIFYMKLTVNNLQYYLNVNILSGYHFIKITRYLIVCGGRNCSSFAQTSYYMSGHVP